jgi:hypothetical protein
VSRIGINQFNSHKLLAKRFQSFNNRAILPHAILHLPEAVTPAILSPVWQRMALPLEFLHFPAEMFDEISRSMHIY